MNFIKFLSDFFLTLALSDVKFLTHNSGIIYRGLIFKLSIMVKTGA